MFLSFSLQLCIGYTRLRKKEKYATSSILNMVRKVDLYGIFESMFCAVFMVVSPGLPVGVYLSIIHFNLQKSKLHMLYGGCHTFGLSNRVFTVVSGSNALISRLLKIPTCLKLCRHSF